MQKINKKRHFTHSASRAAARPVADDSAGFPYDSPPGAAECQHRQPGVGRIE